MNTSQSISLATFVVLFGLSAPLTRVVAQVATAPTSKLQEARKTKTDDAAKEIEWRVLAPDKGKPFNDPFTKLTGEQLANLSYIARVRRLVAEKKIDTDGVDAKAAAKLARNLTREGVDVSYLLVQRKRVQQTRVRQVDDVSKSIAESLGDKQITLTGFVIPITWQQEKLTEFFLVPTVSICNGEAAPSPLRVVLISTEQGVAHSDKRLAVQVKGTVNAKTTTRTIRNGIGITTVQSAYAMLSPEIVLYAQTEQVDPSRKK